MKGFKKDKVRNINWGNKGKIPPRMSGGGLQSVICTNLRRYFQNFDNVDFGRFISISTIALAVIFFLFVAVANGRQRGRVMGAS